MKKVEKITVGFYQTNCYLLWNDQHVMIIDPGARTERIIKKIEDQEGIVDGVFVTHGHLDHIGAVDECVAHFNCPFYCHDADMELLTNPKLNLSFGEKEIKVKSKPIAVRFSTMKIGTFDVEFIDAPGHTDGCCMMICDEFLFAGDVLFKGSIGRVDMIKGSNSKMTNTLNQIKQMDKDYIVYPGHGESTTLMEEFKTNPYL